MIVLQSFYIVAIVLIAAAFLFYGIRGLIIILIEGVIIKSIDAELTILATIMSLFYIAMGTWIYITFIP